MIGLTLTIIMVALIAAIFLLERVRPGMVTAIEENTIAGLLAAITVISFIQVVLRYGFNTGITGALELTTVLFAWLILFGMSYGIKMGMHLGVDAFIRLMPPKMFRVVAVFGAVCCLLYGLILLNADWLKAFGAQTKGGAIDYWTRKFKLGIGMEDMRYPGFLQALGLPERVQRWVAYVVLPIGLSFVVFRSVEAIVAMVRGERELIIAGHEAEELVAENKDALKD